MSSFRMASYLRQSWVELNFNTDKMTENLVKYVTITLFLTKYTNLETKESS